MRVKNGRVAHGTAGAGVFVDNKALSVPAKSGGPDWWAADSLIYAGNDSSELRSIDSDGTGDFLVKRTPVAYVRACPFGWASFSSQSGVKTSSVLPVLPKASLLDMTDDGAVLVGDFYHEQEGTGISVYRLGSSDPLWHKSDARPAVFFPYPQAFALRAECVGWIEDHRTFRVRHNGEFFSLALAGDSFNPSGFEIDGRLWIAYGRADDSVVAHPFDDPSRGFHAGNGFGQVGSYEGGQVVLRWSLTTAEGADDIKEARFDLSTAAPIPPVRSGGSTVPVPPVDPPAELAIEILDWTQTGDAPLRVVAQYRVTGANGKGTIQVLTIDGAVVIANDTGAELQTTIQKHGIYMLGARVSDGVRSAVTGKQRVIVVTEPTPMPEPEVTDAQCAMLLRGYCFEAVSLRLKLSGSEESRRAAVSAWMLERIGWIRDGFREVFGRAADLEGIGSKLLLVLDRKFTRAELIEEMKKDYAKGHR